MGKMKYTDFRDAVCSIQDCKDFEHFFSKQEWQEWTDNYTDDINNCNRIIEILYAIWELRENPVKGIKKVVHTTNEGLSRDYVIPSRTIDAWSSGEKACPEYVWQMLAYCVFSDNGIL